MTKRVSNKKGKSRKPAARSIKRKSKYGEDKTRSYKRLFRHAHG